MRRPRAQDRQLQHLALRVRLLRRVRAVLGAHEGRVVGPDRRRDGVVGEYLRIVS